MLQKKSKSPAEEAEHLIKRYLSASARKKFREDVITLLILIGLIIFLINILIHLPHASFQEMGLCIFIIIITVILSTCFIPLLVFITPRDFHDIRTAESAWVKYQDLLTATPAELQGKLHAAQTDLDTRNYNISALQKEQERLRREYDKEIANLDSQIQTEKNLIKNDDLHVQITLLQQIIALHTPPHT